MSTEDNNNGIETRILEAAKQIFLQKGYEAATMSDIATMVGISRTAMHYYFRTKATIFGAIFTQVVERITPNIEVLVNDEMTILEKLSGIIDLYLILLKENPLLPLFVINEMNRAPQHLFSVYTKNHKLTGPLLHFLQQIEKEMDAGLLRKRPLIDVVSTFIGLNLFPFLGRNALKELFMNGDDNAFNEYVSNRKQLIYDIMYNMLSPE
jgi:AcrR family transcriptional regulator